MGTAVIRLADADRLPFDFTSLADTVAGYVKELQDLLKTMQEEARERARQLDEGVLRGDRRSAAPAGRRQRACRCPRR